MSVHEIQASGWIPDIGENCECVPDFERPGRLDVIQFEEYFASTSEYLFSRSVEREGKWDGNRHLPSCNAGEGDRLDERSLDPRTGRHASLVDRCHGGGIVQCNQVDSRSLRMCSLKQVDSFKDEESMFLQRKCMHWVPHLRRTDKGLYMSQASGAGKSISHDSSRFPLNIPPGLIHFHRRSSSTHDPTRIPSFNDPGRKKLL